MTNHEHEAMMQAYNALHFNLPVIEDFGSKEQLEIQHNAINALVPATEESVTIGRLKNEPTN